ncbi:hypothetical protein Tco_1096764 [Tanacetum coccineum]
MTRSLNKGLVTPYEEHERVLHTTRKLFKTTSHDYSSSLEFDLFFNPEDQFEEENTETTGEPTMEEYMTKTREDYRSGIARPKSDEKARSSDTSDGLDAIQVQLNNLSREIKKVNEKVYAAQVGCKSCNGPHYTKDCSLKEEGKTLEEAYYTQFGVPFPQGERYRVVALGFYQRDNGNPSYQERRHTIEESISKFMDEYAKRHDKNSNLIKEIRASMDAAIRNQGASIKALEIRIGQMSKEIQERGYGSLSSLTETNPRDHVKSISTCEEAETPSIRRIGCHRYNVSIQ